ncbi:phage major capsid protein [Paraburkholderia ferrariae]|uniref:Phage major capsid protein n=1 Tax=Paraburkholderia ferrariae TaxID=386056 RepID=A0ABU9RMK6_9BURK
MYDSDVALARSARAMILAHGDPAAAQNVIMTRWGSAQAAEEIARQFNTRDLVDTGSITGTDPLLENFGNRLAPLVMKKSVLGQIAAMYAFWKCRPYLGYLVPVGNALAGWVAQGQQKPVSGGPSFAPFRLTPKKLVCLVPYSMETLKVVHADIDHAISRDATNALADGLNEAFCNPGNAGDDATPASPFYGHVQAGSGDFEADFAQLIAAIPPDLVAGAVLLVSPLDIPQLLAGGFADHSTLSVRDGGFVNGFPAAVCTSLPVGSIAYVVPQAVGLCDLGVLISASAQATLTADFGDGQGEVEHGLWQENVACTKAEHWISWEAFRDGAAGMITDALTGAASAVKSKAPQDAESVEKAVAPGRTTKAKPTPAVLHRGRKS